MKEARETSQPVMTEAERSFSIHYLTPDNARFFRTDGGFAGLETEGRRYDRVMLFRAFPFTEPDRYLSVREADTKKTEIGIVERLSDFDAPTVELIREQLQLRYFAPKIVRVYSAKDKHGFSTLEVKTDRGHCRFTFRGGSDAVTHLSETRLIFTDLDGNRFEIPDLRQLSRREQKKLDLYL